MTDGSSALTAHQWRWVIAGAGPFRAHLEALGPTMRRALLAAGIARPDVVAATIGPGLAGALMVGVAAAKAYAAAWGVPFYAVNHLGGHLAADV